MRRLLLLLPLLLLIAMPARGFDFLNMKNSLIDFALDQISSDDFTIAAESVESPGDGVTELLGVTIADREGVWFTAERMGLRWNASRILRGELEINRLFAAGVEITRQPQGEVEVKEDAEIAQSDGNLFDWPRSPIALRVDEMALDDVVIAGGVIAEPSIAFDATGNARDEGDEQAVSLTVTRTDDTEGRIALEYLRDFSADTLRLNLDAEEAPGGLVAALSGLPERSRSAMAIDADGPLTDWRLSFRAEAEEVVVAQGSAVVDVEDAIQARAEFTVTPGPEMGPDATALLAPEARFRLDIAEDDQGLVTIREGALSSPALELAARGTFDRPTTQMDLSLDLQGHSGLADPVEGVAFEGFGFRGQITGTIEALDARGEITLDQLATDAADVGAARLNGQVLRKGERIDLALKGGAERLRIDRLGPDLLGEADLDIRGSYDPSAVVLERLVFASGLIDLGAEGRVSLTEETAALSYRLTTPDLAPVAAAYDQNADGAARIEGQLDGPLAAPRLTGSAMLERLAYDGEAYGDVRLTHDVVIDETPGGQVDLEATGSPYGTVTARTDFELADERFSVSGLDATALGVALRGDAAYDLESALVEGEIDIDAPDLAPLAAVAGAPVTGALEGRLGFRPRGPAQDIALDLEGREIAALGARVGRVLLDGDLRDALGAPALDGTVSVSDAAYEEARLASVEGKVAGSDLLTTPDLDIDVIVTGASGFGGAADRVVLDTRVEDAIALARVEGTLSGEGLSYTDVTVGALEADFDAADLAAVLPTGRLDATASGIAASGARIGSADLDATLTDEAESGRLVATATVGRVAAEGAEIDGLKAQATVDGALGPDPVIEALADTGTVTADPLSLSGVVARVEGPLSRLVATLEAEGTVEEDPVSLSAAATADVSGAPISATLSQADLAFAEERISLNRPMQVTVDGGTTRLREIDVALPGGNLAGEAALYPNGLGADIRLDTADLGVLQRLADVPVTDGSLSLAADLDTRPGSARATFSVNAPDLRFAEVLGEGTLGIAADGQWDGRQAALDASVTGPFDTPLSLTAALPLRPTGGPLPAVPRGGEIDGRARWSGRIGDLWALVPAPGHVLDGQLDLDLGIAGTVTEPRIAGRVTLSDGQYQNLDLGTILTRLTMTSELAPNGGIALDLSARDGAQGQVEARVLLEPETVEAQLTTTRAVLVRRDDATAAISMDIAAAGPLTGPDVSGEVVIDKAEIRLVNATPPGVVTLGDVRIKGEPEPEDAEPVGSGIALDVKVRADRDVFVRGRGLDSEWKIDLDVGGSAAAPRVVGAVERVRGRLDLIGTPFDMEKGEVRFSGAAPIDPDIDVRLAAENDGVTGFINVTGRASDPELTFSSRPALPEDEVLPRTLFGKSRQSLNASQALRLAAGVATLLQGSGGTIDRIRGTVGLDQLAIDPTEDGGADVTIGKNIGDDVFVGAKQPLGSDSEPSIAVEIDVFRGITVDGEVEPTGESSVGFSWRKDF